MKTKILVLFWMFLAANFEGFSQEILQNSDVIQMKNFGLEDAVILSKIESSFNDFKTGMSDLKMLSDAGLSSTVINAVMKAANNPDLKPRDLTNPFTDRPAGFYYKYENGMTALEYTNYSNGQVDRAAQVMVSGLINAKQTAMIGGEKSKQVFHDTPEYYMYSENFNSSSFSGYGASSPNSFVCVKLEVKSNSRSVVIGKSSALGSSSGIDPKQTVDFKFEEIAPESGIYRIWFETPLEPGEYGFIHTGTLGIYVGNGASSSNTNRIFDFSIGS